MGTEPPALKPIPDTRETGPERAGSLSILSERGLLLDRPSRRLVLQTDVDPIVQGNLRGNGPVLAWLALGLLRVGPGGGGGRGSRVLQFPAALALDLDGNARRAAGEPSLTLTAPLALPLFFSLNVMLLECVLLTVKLVRWSPCHPGSVTLIVVPVVAVVGTVAVIWVAEFTANVARSGRFLEPGTGGARAVSAHHHHQWLQQGFAMTGWRIGYCGGPGRGDCRHGHHPGPVHHQCRHSMSQQAAIAA